MTEDFKSICDRLNTFMEDISNDLKSPSGLERFWDLSSERLAEANQLIDLFQAEIDRQDDPDTLRDRGDCDYSGVLLLN